MDSIETVNLIKNIKKHWRLIILITLIALLISGCISYYLLKPVYRASTQILVNQKTAENQIDYTLLQSNVNLIKTYSGIIKSPVILEKVVNKLELTSSWEELNDKISVTSQEDSQIFILNVEDTNAARAVEIANTISETFREDIKSIMSVDNVSILAKAEMKKNPIPIKPNPIMNMGLATIAGLMIGVGLVILLELIDNTLKSDQDVEAYLGVPVLGSVQKMTRVYTKGKIEQPIQSRGGEPLVTSVTSVTSVEK